MHVVPAWHTPLSHGNWKACIAYAWDFVQSFVWHTGSARGLDYRVWHHTQSLFFFANGPLYITDMRNTKCILQPHRLNSFETLYPRQNNGHWTCLLYANLLQKIVRPRLGGDSSVRVRKRAVWQEGWSDHAQRERERETRCVSSFNII